MLLTVLNAFNKGRNLMIMMCTSCQNVNWKTSSAKGQMRAFKDPTPIHSYKKTLTWDLGKVKNAGTIPA